MNAENSSSEKRPPQKSKRILIITSDQREVDNITPYLDEFDYQWKHAADAINGAVEYEEFQPDLVILSALVPKGGGWEVCHAIRKKNDDQDTIIIVTSPVASGTIQLEGRVKWGANEVVTLPISIKRLIRLIARLLGEEDLVSQWSSGGHMIVRNDTSITLPTKKKKIAKSGNLNDVSLGRLLSLVVKKNYTGKLILGEGKYSRILLVEDGRILGIESGYIENLALGEILVQLGWIDQQVVHVYLAEAKQKGQRFGEILRTAGMISEDRLMLALQEQVVRKIGDVFSWKTGKYEFLKQDHIDAVSDPLNFPLVKATFRAAKYSANPVDFEQEYALWLDRTITLRETAAIRPNLIDLSPEEMRLIFSLTGDRTIREILAKSPLPVNETRTLFSALLRLGMVGTS